MMKQRHEKDVLLVRFKKHVSARSAQKKLSTHGCKKVREGRRFTKISVPDGALEQVQAELIMHADVEVVQRNSEVTLHWLPTEPQYPNIWHLQNDGIYAPVAWELTRGNSTVVVAVLDTGIRTVGTPGYHPDIAGQLLPGYSATPAPYNDPVAFHGTMVAGTIAGIANGYGTVGLAPSVKIVPVRIDTAEGYIYVSDIVEGLDWAAANPDVDIINMSLGTLTDNALLREAVTDAWAAGKVLVASAGNWGVGFLGNLDFSIEPNAINYPAMYPEVISVSASSPERVPAIFSNFDSGVDICAPGEMIYSTVTVNALGETGWYGVDRQLVLADDDDGYGYWNGTSASGPLVCAALALAKSINPDLTNAQLKQLVLDNADSFGFAGHGSKHLNAGRVAVAANATLATPTAITKKRVWAKRLPRTTYEDFNRTLFPWYGEQYKTISGNIGIWWNRTDNGDITSPEPNTLKIERNTANYPALVVFLKDAPAGFLRFEAKKLIGVSTTAHAYCDIDGVRTEITHAGTYGSYSVPYTAGCKRISFIWGGSATDPGEALFIRNVSIAPQDPAKDNLTRLTADIFSSEPVTGPVEFYVNGYKVGEASSYPYYIDVPDSDVPDGTVLSLEPLPVQVGSITAASVSLTPTVAVGALSGITASTGTISAAAVSLRPSVAAPSLQGIRAGSMSAASVSLRPSLSPATLSGVQVGSMSVPAVTLRPSVAVGTLSGIEAVSVGSIAAASTTMQIQVNPPTLRGVTAGTAIRAPDGTLWDLRDIYGAPLDIRAVA